MPKVKLTYSDYAKGEVEKYKLQILGVKGLKKMSWDDIANKMGVPRATLKYRFDKGILTLSEWMELCHVLGIKREELGNEKNKKI